MNCAWNATLRSACRLAMRCANASSAAGAQPPRAIVDAEAADRMRDRGADTHGDDRVRRRGERQLRRLDDGPAGGPGRLDDLGDRPLADPLPERAVAEHVPREPARLP